MSLGCSCFVGKTCWTVFRTSILGDFPEKIDQQVHIRRSNQSYLHSLPAKSNIQGLIYEARNDRFAEPFYDTMDDRPIYRMCVAIKYADLHPILENGPPPDKVYTPYVDVTLAACKPPCILLIVDLIEPIFGHINGIQINDLRNVCIVGFMDVRTFHDNDNEHFILNGIPTKIDGQKMSYNNGVSVPVACDVRIPKAIGVKRTHSE